MTCLALLTCLPGSSPGQTGAVPVANPSFEEGGAAVTGWTLSGGHGGTVPGDDGARAIAVTGDGTDSNFWRSSSLEWAPDTVYAVSFRARSQGASGGTPTTGPVFANRDLGGIAETWQPYRSVFMTPHQIRPDESWLRFGQWEVKGTVAFDAVRLQRAEPLYVRAGGLTLGAGELLGGNAYHFSAPYSEESGNSSRPLASHRCNFNSNRWTFGADSDVVYRHALPGRRQTAASIDVVINWYQGGELLVQAGRDGQNWRDLGRLSGLKSGSFAVPDDLLPADAVWVRLSATAKARVGANSDPGSFQVNSYTYTATVDGPAAAELRGATRFLTVEQDRPGLELHVVGLGEALPGGANVLRVEATKPPAGWQLTARVEPVDGAGAAATQRVALRDGVTELPYTVPGSGLFRMVVSAESPVAPQPVQWRGSVEFRVAELYRADFGELLPTSSPRVGLWGCSSGWKVSQSRPLPTQQGSAVTIRAARNEAEAAQVVLRPTQPLFGLLPKPGALSGPGGAQIPASAIDVLRVRYVTIEQPTDATSTAAPWPDPLPPFSAPLDLKADLNQPLWLRVKVPRGVPAGSYRGQVALTADGWQASVPLAVEVFDFTLPDTMTCETAFGFSPSNVFRYQKLTDPAQQRLVLDKYLRNYGEHHIAVYDPAPLDRFDVKWRTGQEWEGGLRDTTEKHGGQASRRVEDTSTTQGFSARWPELIAIPPGGLRLSLWYKTKAAGQQTIVTLGHNDANRQWMSGRNLDLPLTGDGTWQHFERTIKEFPAGAKFVNLGLWATLWTDDGHNTGTVWYDDVALTDAATGAVLLQSGFETAAKPEDLQPTFDFSRWDVAVQRAFDEYHFNTLSIPIQGMGGGTFDGRTEPELLGYREGTPEYTAAFHNYCQGLEQHLREKGWLDKSYVYWFDEPDPKDYDFVMAGNRRLKEHAPGIRRMLTEQPEPGLIGGPNLWCPISNEFRQATADPRMAAGDQFWWYVCTGPKAPYCTEFIDHPGSELRCWLWQTWQRKIRGVLVWETSYWTSESAYPEADKPQNPYTDPQSWVSGYHFTAGTRIGWGNGDGRFVYPPEACADGKPARPVLDGPVDSQRWELLRDGIEDYEYLAMLQRELKRLGTKLPAAERTAAEALLRVPPEITTDAVTFSTSPAPMEARRAQIAAMLARLGHL